MFERGPEKERTPVPRLLGTSFLNSFIAFFPGYALGSLLLALRRPAGRAATSPVRPLHLAATSAAPTLVFSVLADPLRTRGFDTRAPEVNAANGLASGAIAGAVLFANLRSAMALGVVSAGVAVGTLPLRKAFSSGNEQKGAKGKEELAEPGEQDAEKGDKDEDGFFSFSWLPVRTIGREEAERIKKRENVLVVDRKNERDERKASGADRSLE